MAKKLRKRLNSLKVINRNKDLVLRVLHNSDEGLVLKALMQNPEANTIANLVEETGLNRYYAEKAAEELVRRGLAKRIRTPVGHRDRHYSSYQYRSSQRFPELKP